jgi:hypothetical protein
MSGGTQKEVSAVRKKGHKKTLVSKGKHQKLTYVELCDWLQKEKYLQK